MLFSMITYFVCLYVTSVYGDIPYYVEGLFSILMALYLKTVAMATILNMMPKGSHMIRGLT